MEGRNRPRRPAILDPKDAELLWGDSDPALASEAAHATADAVLYGPRHTSADGDLAARVGAIIDAEGLDEIAALWSRSPASTLPGTLWRLYLVRAWIARDPDTIAERFRAGGAAGASATGDDGHVLEPGELSEALSQLFAGTSDRDLADLLRQAAAFLRTLAASSETGWQTGDEEAARPVTGRTNAITATAEELEASAARSRAGTLD